MRAIRAIIGVILILIGSLAAADFESASGHWWILSAGAVVVGIAGLASAFGSGQAQPDLE